MTGARRRSGPAAGPLTRVAIRLTTPTVYLAVLGGLQVLVLWMLRAHFGWWLPLGVTLAYLALLAFVARVGDHWRLKLWGVGLLGVIVAVGPTLIGVVQRPRVGLTMEHDGLLQVESAIDRLLQGRPIYGVDWSNTPMASFPWELTPGPNPALHHLAYYPLTVLVGVPFRLVTGALGLPFDYRIVLIAFAFLGLGAIAALPIDAERRFMLITTIYLSPLITLYLWAGRNDIEFLAVLLLSLALLARSHPTFAAAALGVAVALKPFAWVAVPFLLLVLYLRWRKSRSTREVVFSLVALAIVPVATIVPFVVANPTAFWTDIVLYAAGGIPDAYPIAGYGFGELLFDTHLVAHRTDSFPFGIFQLAVMIPVLWIGARAFLRRPTLGRWMAGYSGLLLAFTFFARFFNDNYVGVVITLLLCIRPLGDRSLAPAVADQADRLAA